MITVNLTFRHKSTSIATEDYTEAIDFIHDHIRKEKAVNFISAVTNIRIVGTPDAIKTLIFLHNSEKEPK